MTANNKEVPPEEMPLEGGAAKRKSVSDPPRDQWQEFNVYCIFTFDNQPFRASWADFIMSCVG